MKKTTLVLATFASILFTSCNSTIAKFGAINQPHIIALYGNNGVLIQQWESVGRVSNSESSDGWYFMDAKTGKLVEVSGTIIITIK